MILLLLFRNGFLFNSLIQIHRLLFLLSFEYLYLYYILFLLKTSYDLYLYSLLYRNFNDFLGRIHFSLFFIASNLILFSMHSLGIFGFARRIFDYPVIFFRYHWSNSFGMYGVALSMFFFLCPFLLFNLSVISFSNTTALIGIYYKHHSLNCTFRDWTSIYK